MYSIIRVYYTQILFHQRYREMVLKSCTREVGDRCIMRPIVKYFYQPIFFTQFYIVHTYYLVDKNKIKIIKKL